MENVRWESPFKYTLAFHLFEKHIREINAAYWSMVPVANTTKSTMKKNMKSDADDPRKLFLISDDDDKRVASTYKDWKVGFSQFEKYTRLNVVMMLSSCFETYLRTVVSLAFESKPGIMLNFRDAVDGAKILKNNIAYGNMEKSEYLFTAMIDKVCRGEWTNRFNYFQNYFGELPSVGLDCINELEGLRKTRNNFGHYLDNM